MANTIVTKNSSTASAVPTAADLVQGELAVNVTDKRLFTENASGTVVELGTNPSTIAVAGNATVGGTLGVTGVATLTANPVLSGGTANGIAYLNGSKVVTSGSALTFDGTNVGIGTSSPATTIDVNGGTTNQVAIFRSSDAIASIGFADNTTPLTGNLSYVTIGANGSSMVFNTNLAEKMRLDSSGNLGLGVTPSAWNASFKAFDIGSSSALIDGGTSTRLLQNAYIDAAGQPRYKNTASAALLGLYGNEYRFYQASSGTAGNAISFTQAMTLDASGNLLVGATSKIGSDNRELDINASTAGHSSGLVFSVAGTKVAGISSASTYTAFGSTTSAPLILQTGGTERARIDSSGNLLVGTTSASTSVPTSGRSLQWSRNSISRTFLGISSDTGDGTVQIGLNFGDSASRPAIVFNRWTYGQVGAINCSSTATSYATSSDYRLKNTIAPMTGALAKVAALKPCTYKWNADGSDGEGFIAHELAEVCPQAVTGEKDAVDADGNPVYQGIDTSFLVATLTAAIQELKAEVDALKSEINTLKGI